MPNSGNVVSDEEILRVFEGAEAPVLKTSDVADEIALNQQRTGQRLQALMEAGHVRGKRVGRGFVWWHPEMERLWTEATEDWE